jgi:hypothetical protein
MLEGNKTDEENARGRPILGSALGESGCPASGHPSLAARKTEPPGASRAESERCPGERHSRPWRLDAIGAFVSDSARYHVPAMVRAYELTLIVLYHRGRLRVLTCCAARR